MTLQLMRRPLTDIQEEDVTDGNGEKQVDEMCTYILIDSRDELSISLTPHAIDVIMTVSKVYTCMAFRMVVSFSHVS